MKSRFAAAGVLRKTARLAAAGLVSLYLPSAHAAEWIKQGEEKVKISAGVFLTSFDSDMEVENRRGGQTSDIDLENDLGLTDNETTYWGSATWRPAPEHRVSIGFIRFERDGKATAERDLVFDDEIFPAGASVKSTFDLDIVPLTYSYSILKRDDMEFALNLGVHWFNMDIKVRGSSSLDDTDLNADGSASADGPLPLIGFRYEYFISERWAVGILGEAFALDLNDDDFDLNGTLWNARVSTDYWIYNNVGVGAALNYFRLDADVDENDWIGSLEYDYYGPQLYLTARF